MVAELYYSEFNSIMGNLNEIFRDSCFGTENLLV